MKMKIADITIICYLAALLLLVVWMVYGFLAVLDYLKQAIATHRESYQRLHALSLRSLGYVPRPATPGAAKRVYTETLV